MPIDLTPKHRLGGKMIFISTSIPDSEDKSDAVQSQQTEQRIHSAVIAMARRVFYEGGWLVFRWHPSLSPLILLTLRHYRTPEFGANLPTDSARESNGPGVTMFQSEVCRRTDTDIHSADHRNGRSGVKLVWTDAVDDEGVTVVAREQAQKLKSIYRMREQMIAETMPDAMVMIGGTNEITEEMTIFQRIRPGKPVYLFETTGGAAAMLAQKARSSPSAGLEMTFGGGRSRDVSGAVRVIDSDVGLFGRARELSTDVGDVAGMTFSGAHEADRRGANRARSPIEPLRHDAQDRLAYVPYELFVGRLVDELVAVGSDRGPG